MTAAVTELPPRLHLKSGRYYYVKRSVEKKVVWTALSRDLSEALHQHALLEAGRTAEALAAGEPPQHWLSGIAKTLHQQAAKRARDSDIFFSLTVDDVASLGVATNWRCALTGLRFNQDAVGPKGARPFMPSLDRVNSARGYVPNNCRLVCVAVNFAMNSWGQEVLHRVALAYVKHNRLTRALEDSHHP